MRIISCAQATQALQLLRQNGSRFPLDECEKRLAVWLNL